MALTGRTLTEGNQVLPLINGDEAYPAMLEAVHRAQSSIGLATYIFDNDTVGQEFAAALSAAQRRGVAVRVMVDATGARYSFPSIIPLLKRHEIRAALFMPASSLRKIGTLNLRCHRKILVVDGQVGFTGGMNLRVGNTLKAQPTHPIQDLHFRFEGPVVGHIRDTFIDDWAFTTGEVLEGSAWTPDLLSRGDVWARGILDGPDENYEKILLTIMGAMARAKRSIRILTPYFLPDPTTLKTLTIAAMSGVEIDIVIPEKNNVKLVQWASMASVAPLLTHGVRLHLAPPPFDHSKLILVDDLWSFMGSANWDSRSLQLNFEFNIECYNERLARHLTGIFADKLSRSRPLTLDDLAGRPLAVKLRDGAVRLLAPYL
jgi:cardiolipin synthase